VPRNFCAEIAQLLTEWTGSPWKVMSGDAATNPSLHEQAEARKKQAMQAAAEHPLVSSVMQQFPGAKLLKITENA
jgi:hypothetical protein